MAWKQTVWFSTCGQHWMVVESRVHFEENVLQNSTDHTCVRRDLCEFGSRQKMAMVLGPRSCEHIMLFTFRWHGSSIIWFSTCGQRLVEVESSIHSGENCLQNSLDHTGVRRDLCDCKSRCKMALVPRSFDQLMCLTFRRNRWLLAWPCTVHVAWMIRPQLSSCVDQLPPTN